jgi:hypothetical protein
MSLSLVFDEDTSPLKYAACLNLPKRYALAIDGVRVLATSLAALIKRIEKQLIAISTSPIESNLDQALTALVITDVGVFLNDFHRLHVIAEKHLGIKAPSGDSLATDIKLVRNSLQHIEDRLDEYFMSVGDSLFGNLYWRFRSDDSKVDSYFTLTSGITSGISNFTGGTTVESETGEYIGVYDVYYAFVIKKGKQTETISIWLDKAVSFASQLIMSLEAGINDGLSRFQKDNPGDALPMIAVPPLIYTVQKTGPALQ